jgi:4-hydroxy-tetrahydrodipicolinate synthase
MKIAPQYYGIFAALTTPFTSKGELDESIFLKQIQCLSREKVAGVVIGGTTGEGICLSCQEKTRLIHLCASLAPSFTIIAGVTALTASDAISQGESVLQAGAHALLVPPPYYVRPDQPAISRFYQAILNALVCPLILYNHPKRTGVSIEPLLLQDLVKHPHIIGLKEADDTKERLREITPFLPKEFALLGGNDSSWIQMLKSGGSGVISVGANIAPWLYQTIWENWKSTQTIPQDTLHALNTLNIALDTCPNPVSIKFMCKQLEHSHALRVPLSFPSDAQRSAMETAMTFIQKERP